MARGVGGLLAPFSAPLVGFLVGCGNGRRDTCTQTTSPSELTIGDGVHSARGVLPTGVGLLKGDNLVLWLSSELCLESCPESRSAFSLELSVPAQAPLPLTVEAIEHATVDWCADMLLAAAEGAPESCSMRGEHVRGSCAFMEGICSTTDREVNLRVERASETELVMSGTLAGCLSTGGRPVSKFNCSTGEFGCFAVDVDRERVVFDISLDVKLTDASTLME